MHNQNRMLADYLMIICTSQTLPVGHRDLRMPSAASPQLWGGTWDTLAELLQGQALHLFQQFRRCADGSSATCRGPGVCSRTGQHEGVMAGIQENPTPGTIVPKQSRASLAIINHHD